MRTTRVPRPVRLTILFVIGGTSAEATLKTVKLASTRYYDALPTEGTNTTGVPRCFARTGTAPRKAQNLGLGVCSLVVNTSLTISARIRSAAPRRLPAQSAWVSPVPQTVTSKRKSTATDLIENWSTTRQYIPESLRQWAI